MPPGPPASVSVAPLPIADGVIVPVITTGCAVKFTAVAFVVVTVTDCVEGLKVKPLFDGVTV